MEKIIELLASETGAEVIKKGAEKYFYIPEEYGQGCIKGIDFNNGLGLFYVEGNFKEDLWIHYEGEKVQPLRMIFCLEGELIHILLPDNILYKLAPLKGSIALSSDKNKQSIKLSAHQNIIFYLIEINKAVFFQKIQNDLENVSDKIGEALKDAKNKEHFLYENDYSLLIAEVLKEINENNFEGLVRRIFLEAKVLEIISYQFKQYLDDLKPFAEQVVLRKKDVTQLFEARQILLNNLQRPPIIKELAKLVGINENKLKRGFKKIFGVTINSFITEKRLEQARILLAEEQMPVREISEKIGYKSTSAFTKVFKKKFGVTPRQFLKRYSL